MPIYEYICQACGKELEQLQKISDAPLADCPICGKSSLRKKISAVGFQLKGTGWYATDFKDKPKPKPETTDAAKTEEKKEVGNPSQPNSAAKEAVKE